jgi:hypothetical protein
MGAVVGAVEELRRRAKGPERVFCNKEARGLSYRYMPRPTANLQSTYHSVDSLTSKVHPKPPECAMSLD